MHRPQMTFLFTILAFVCSPLLRTARAGEWPKLLDHPRAGTNAIALVNADALRLGALKLKNYKGGEQKGAAANLMAELPEHVKKAALSSFLDLDTLDPVWEMGTLIFEKNKLPTPTGIATHEGGYVDDVAGRKVIWSPRNRYILLQNADRLTINKPADRPAVANWIRSLTKGAVPLPDYLKRAAERTSDNAPLVLAIEMVDAVSPIPLKEKMATLQSLAGTKIDLGALAKLFGEIQGITFSISTEEQFQGQLQIDFSSAATLLQKHGKPVVLEILGRRGILLPEMKEWEGHVEGKALILSGPINAMSIVNLLSLFSSTPSADTSPDESSENSQSEEKKKGQMSKRYFTSVTRIVEETRNLKGVGIGEHGIWNDKLSRKIDQLPILGVDPDVLNYGANVSQLLRGAGITIRKANIVAGTQIAPDVTTTASAGFGVGYGGGYGYGAYSINNNEFYNQQVWQQAHATGITQHISNLEQIDNLTRAIRRAMTERYQVEF